MCKQWPLLWLCGCANSVNEALLTVWLHMAMGIRLGHQTCSQASIVLWFAFSIIHWSRRAVKSRESLGTLITSHGCEMDIGGAGGAQIQSYAQWTWEHFSYWWGRVLSILWTSGVLPRVILLRTSTISTTLLLSWIILNTLTKNKKWGRCGNEASNKLPVNIKMLFHI